MIVATFIPVIEVMLKDDLTIFDYRINWEDSYVSSWDIQKARFIRGIDESDASGNARTFINALCVHTFTQGAGDQPMGAGNEPF
jgi:hypothetical protein